MPREKGPLVREASEGLASQRFARHEYLMTPGRERQAGVAKHMEVHRAMFSTGQTYCTLCETICRSSYCCQPVHPHCKDSEKESSFASSPWVHHIVREITNHTH